MPDEVRAYIAGFLDGDGCIMAQLIRRNGYRLGFQIRVSVVFYQHQSHNEILFWLKRQLGYGYVRDRNDAMCEYTIVGLREVEEVLTSLTPHLRVKKQLAHAVLEIIERHPWRMTAEDLVALSEKVDATARFNYSKRRSNTCVQVSDFLRAAGLVPVETEG
jgi:hypothetical protein